MRAIPTRIHGIVDYLTGVLLIVLPWLIGTADGSAAQWGPIAAGLASVVYAALTDYELGVVPLLSMRVHLAIDAVIGLLLLISPWLFGFADRVTAPFVLLGLFALAMSVLTRTAPENPRGAVTGRA